jgi:hypothetical protein
MKFIEVSASGEWLDEISDYKFEAVDKPTFFATDRIEWFQMNDDDSLTIGIIRFETVFKVTNQADIVRLFEYINRR